MILLPGLGLEGGVGAAGLILLDPFPLNVVWLFVCGTTGRARPGDCRF